MKIPSARPAQSANGPISASTAKLKWKRTQTWHAIVQNPKAQTGATTKLVYKKLGQLRAIVMSLELIERSKAGDTLKLASLTSFRLQPNILTLTGAM
jgi:hypothetical protein